MGEWKDTNLRKVCADIAYGYTASADDQPVGPKFLRITDIVGERISWDAVPYCRINDHDKAKYRLEIGDIVIARTGATTGYNAIIKDPVDSVFASYLVRYKVDRNVADPFFVSYNLKSQRFHEYVDAIAGGSAQPGANAKQLADFEFRLPPLPEQRAIASVLSSLDDKIDLLHRQNKTLEALAETVFREWFVEQVSDSQVTQPLEELVQFDPTEKITNGVEPRYFDMKCLSNNSMSIADGIMRRVNSGSSFRNGDTLLAKITPCLENGKTGFVMNLEDGEVARGSTEFIVMRAKKKVSPYFVYCLARSGDFRNTAILSMTGTSGRQRVQTQMLKKYEIKYAPERMELFHNECEPIFLKVKQNQTQIRTLTQLRDTLLPKLMSGEVRLRVS